MKKKFRLHPETLEIQPVNEQRLTLQKYILQSIFLTLFIAVIVFFALTFFLPDSELSKKEQDLQYLKENYETVLQKFNLARKFMDSLQKQEKQIYRLTFETDSYILFNPYQIAFTQQTPEHIILEKPFQAIDSLLVKTQFLLNEYSERLQRFTEMIFAMQTMLKRLPATLPVEKNSFTVVSGFGRRIHPVLKTVRHHNGIDLAVRQGSPVYATGDGVVIETPLSLSELGNVVIIDHGYGFTSIYGCLLKPEVKPGTRVRRGDIIGYSGKSGIALGPHLHYEVRFRNRPLNPVNFFFLELTPVEFYDILRKSSIYNQAMS